jgi:hypothetical protein
MDYLVEGTIYGLDYQELKKTHEEMCALPDNRFLKKLPEAIHLACIISFFKELRTCDVLSDEGIIHELVHLLSGTEVTTTLDEIRKEFKQKLKLS